MHGEFQRIQAEWYKFRASLYDRASGLPTLYAVFDELKKIVEEERTIGVIYLAVGDEPRIEPIFGWEIYDELVKQFTICVLGEIGRLIPRTALVTISSTAGDGFFVFLNRTMSGAKIGREYLESVLARFSEKFQKLKAEFLYAEVRERIDFHYGCGMIYFDPMVRTERLIYQTIEELKYAAHFKEKLRERNLYIKLQQIIQRQDISIVYQPIYNLLDNSLFGYEALARGPVGSYFEDPDTIFAFAAKSNLLFQVERLCLDKAISNAKNLPPFKFLFINITPILIPQLIDNEFVQKIVNLNLKNNLVIEITEKFAIPDYAMYHQIIHRTKSYGIKIALDDVGIGYSTLERISEITPDYLKYDRTLVRDIDKNLIRQELARSFVEFARKINSTIIAEGIENVQELKFIKEIGINYGQGFFLSWPISVGTNP
ncbi:MAG: EAL domain-containing protein [candidate division WOR-3 bacterium]